MLSLDYAKQTKDGYVMTFFADSKEDINDISNGKEFITKNGTNYGAPAEGSVVMISSKASTDVSYVLDSTGEWELKNNTMDRNIFEFVINSDDVILKEEDDKTAYYLTNDTLLKLGEFIDKIDFSKMVSGIFSVTESNGVDYLPLCVFQNGGNDGTVIGWAGFVNAAVNSATGKVDDFLGECFVNGPAKIKVICE